MVKDAVERDDVSGKGLSGYTFSFSVVYCIGTCKWFSSAERLMTVALDIREFGMMIMFPR